MQGRWMVLVGFVGCGTYYSRGAETFSVVDFDIEVALGGVLSLATCPIATTDLTVEVSITERTDVCPLEIFTRDDGELGARGICHGIPTGRDRLVKMQLRAAFGSRPVLAEMLGSVALTGVTTSRVLLYFNPKDSPLLEAQTFAGPNDPAEEQLRFNCDINGLNTCATPESGAAAAASDACSNLQELCAGTLFTDVLSTDCAP